MLYHFPLKEDSIDCITVNYNKINGNRRPNRENAPGYTPKTLTTRLFIFKVMPLFNFTELCFSDFKELPHMQCTPTSLVKANFCIFSVYRYISSLHL